VRRPACVILGGKLPKDAPRILSACGRIVAADSGAGRLYALDTPSPILPEAIVGDLDSITPATRAHYAALDVEIMDLGHDQETTDMQKALELLLQGEEKGSRGADGKDQLGDRSETMGNGSVVGGCERATPVRLEVGALEPDGAREIYRESDGRPTIILLGSLDGRVDHTLQNINMCLRYEKRARLLLVSDESVCEVVPAGPTVLEIDRACEGDTCGLLPLGSDVQVRRTEGLVYPCSGLTLAWGGLLSTSNKVAPNVAEVVIDAAQPLFWVLTRHGEASEGPAL
jgi:thiamine pyrophosphokinase